MPLRCPASPPSDRRESRRSPPCRAQGQDTAARAGTTPTPSSVASLVAYSLSTSGNWLAARLMTTLLLLGEAAGIKRGHTAIMATGGERRDTRGPRLLPPGPWPGLS